MTSQIFGFRCPPFALQAAEGRQVSGTEEFGRWNAECGKFESQKFNHPLFRIPHSDFHIRLFSINGRCHVTGAETIVDIDDRHI